MFQVAFFFFAANKLISSSLGSRVRAASTINASQILPDSIPTKTEVIKPGDIGEVTFESAHWS